MLLAEGREIAHRRAGRWIKTQSSPHLWGLTRVSKEAGQGGPPCDVTPADADSANLGCAQSDSPVLGAHLTRAADCCRLFIYLVNVTVDF